MDRIVDVWTFCSQPAYQDRSGFCFVFVNMTSSFYVSCSDLFIKPPISFGFWYTCTRIIKLSSLKKIHMNVVGLLILITLVNCDYHANSPVAFYEFLLFYVHVRWYVYRLNVNVLYQVCYTFWRALSFKSLINSYMFKLSYLVFVFHTVYSLASVDSV